MQGLAATRKPPAEAAPSAEASQYLAFALGVETFAVRLLTIKEIIEYRPLTEMPMAPRWIAGVINLRGAAVPVVDLSVRFGRPAATVTKRTCIVIVEASNGGKQQSAGVVVDSVNAVLEIAPAEIEPPPPFGVKIEGDFLAGLAKVEGRSVILLNIDRVVATGGLAAAG